MNCILIIIKISDFLYVLILIVCNIWQLVIYTEKLLI